MYNSFFTGKVVLLGGLVALQCLVGWTVHADVARICVNSTTGALRVAIHCSTSETWLNNVGSLMGPAGPQGPEGPTRSLYDADGQRIAPVSSIGCKLFNNNYGRPFDAVTVLLENAGALYPVCAERQGFFSTISVIFSSSDCSGQAYTYDDGSNEFPSSVNSLFAAGAIARNGDRRILYRPDYEAGRQYIKVNSFLHIPGLCATGAGGYLAAVLPMIEVADVSAMYKAPFSVR